MRDLTYIEQSTNGRVWILDGYDSAGAHHYLGEYDEPWTEDEIKEYYGENVYLAPGVGVG